MPVDHQPKGDCAAKRVSPWRKPITTLWIVSFLLPLTIFYPAAKWGWQAIHRSQTVRAGDVEAEVSRFWMVRQKGARLEAWKPCLTLFCMSPSASMSFLWMGHQSCSQTLVMHSTEVVFTGKGFIDAKTSQIGIGTTTLECLGAKRSPQSSGTVYSCFNSESCIMGTFEGTDTDLAAFYRVEAAARHNSP